MPNTIKRWLLAPLLIALVGACAAQPPAPAPAVDTAAITAALDSVNQGFAAAVTARDTNAVVNFYSDDARVLPAGMPAVHGRDAIRLFWVEMLKTPGLAISITRNTPIISEAGDLIVDVGSYRMTMNDASGKPMEDVGKYVTVLKKVNGAWKIVVDTINSDKAPAGK